MTAGEIDVRVITRHLAALREALQVLSKHSDTPIENLESDPNERWAVERGLHLCAQNSLDIAIPMRSLWCERPACTRRSRKSQGRRSFVYNSASWTSSPGTKAHCLKTV
jgi:hypothetical protein